MAPRKAALTAIFLVVSLTLAAFQSPQFQAQTGSNRALLLTLTAAPSPPPSLTPNPTVSPVTGAQQWLAALNSQQEDQILERVCPSEQGNVREHSAWVAAFPPLAPIPARLLSQLEGIGQALEFEIINQDEGRARVRVHGNLPVSGPGLLAVYGVDERWLMVYEEGLWRWCGASQGDATPTLTPTITRTPLPISRPDRAGSSSSPTWWRILLAVAAILGAIAKIFDMVQRSRAERH